MCEQQCLSDPTSWDAWVFIKELIGMTWTLTTTGDLLVTRSRTKHHVHILANFTVSNMQKQLSFFVAIVFASQPIQDTQIEIHPKEG